MKVEQNNNKKTLQTLIFFRDSNYDPVVVLVVCF
jgi:hypothetical protein